jgi:predicted acetyltransferase
MTSIPDGLELRPLAEAELPDFVELEGLVWGWPGYDSRARFYGEFLDHDYSWGVFRDGRLVATHGIVRLQLAVPGGKVVNAAGFTILTVHPEFRGRGLMSLLTNHALDLVRAAGSDPVATGVPHHSRTHLQYGFGIAARHASVELDVAGQRELRELPAEGRIDYLDAKTALADLDDLSRRMVRVRNGWIPRKPCASAYQYSGAAQPDGEYGPVIFVLHRGADGAADGFLSYRLTSGCDAYGRPNGAMRVVELFGVSAAAEAQLWRHCLGNPVVTRITATRRPVSDPIAARLPEPRAWRQVIRDDMILCVVDIPSALAARCYGRDDTVVLEVRRPPGDPDGAPAARVELSGGLDGARCRPTTAAADLTITLSALGAAYLGDVSIIDLAASGQAVEHVPGSLRRASAMFSWSPAPWLQDTF